MFTNSFKIIIGLFIALGIGLLSVPVYAEEASKVETAYMLELSDSLLDKFSPIFLIEGNEEAHNKIGTPAARYSRQNHEKIYIDSDVSTLYSGTYTFTTDKGSYTNLVYRIHFAKSPFTWVPFNAGTGKNIGVIVVITLDEDQKPVFVNTVQSCGCYHAIVPTNHLPETAYADDWSPNGRMVYGEYVPARLDFSDPNDEAYKVVVSIRSGTHRTMGIAVMSQEDVQQTYPVVLMKSASLESLRTLPLGETTTSFYHERGRKRGLVKGAHKPLETMLFGLWTWDSHVGQDREYASKEESGHRFYTTLQASKKKDSDMWHYAHYLRHNGWKP